MVQMARNLTDEDEPFLGHTRFLVMDRDTKYSAGISAALDREGSSLKEIRSSASGYGNDGEVARGVARQVCAKPILSLVPSDVAGLSSSAGHSLERTASSVAGSGQIQGEGANGMLYASLQDKYLG